jgi:hypothetical protein
MIGEKPRKVFFLLIIFLFLIVFELLQLLPLNTAQAVPSFKRQTGISCNQCHTVFPELTPFGRSFKLGGYVMSKTGKSYEFPPPLSGMVQASYTNVRGLTSGVAPFDYNNRESDGLNLPQQVSLFYGGRIYDKIGAFIQGTYDGASNKIFLDMTDIRYANNTMVWGKNLIYGFTLNNSPSVQDVWNTTPAWRFPFASSSVAPTPAAGVIIDGALDQQVGGIGAYVFWNNLIYLGAAVYRTADEGIALPLGAGTVTEQIVDGTAPYWRLALEHRWKNHFFTLGTYGMQTDIFPSGNSSGPADRFTDIAFDAQYQYMGTIEPEDIPGVDDAHKAKAGKYMITAHATWIRENQDWKASFPLGNTANRSDLLTTFRMNLNYYYRSLLGDIGGSMSYFSTTGEADSLLYASNPVAGSRMGSPDSDGFILEASYRPWEKTKISIQYTIYNKFNGASSNYDGFGQNASDNNTLYVVVWQMF